MGGPINAFYGALRDIFGPVKTNVQSNAAALATVVATPTTNQAVYVFSLDLLASAAGAGTFQLVDASASGVGGPVFWQTHAIPTVFSHDFTRPLGPFTHGLLVNYTATAGTTLDSNVQFAITPVDR